MKNGHNYGTNQLFNFARDSYLERTSRPIYAVVFLLPFIVFYELGTILINTDILNQSQVRVVAFVWLQNFLEYLGAGSRLAWAAPPLVVVAILIGLQLASRRQWYCKFGDMLPMAVECILLAAPLIVLSLILSRPTGQSTDVAEFTDNFTQVRTEAGLVGSGIAEDGLRLMSAVTNEGAVRQGSLTASIVTGIGAGIYEELIFRLILICVLMILFQDVFGFARTNAIVLSVLISAALFSAHHHFVFVQGQFGYSAAFSWPEFAFRTVAGVYFAILFAFRGFGITAGTHAFYDIIATIVNAVFFSQYA
jgi:hypothetical protein